MSTSRNYQTQGIILKQNKLGEHDKIITIYTPEFGKIKAVAKGACRPKSKLGGNVEPLTYSLMLLAKGRNLDIVTQSQTINGFLSLKSDLWRMACGLYILELIDSFTVEGGDNRPLFDLLIDALNQLMEPNNSESVLRYFELQLLHHLGYRPQLHRCVICNSQLKPVANFFNPSIGGVLCPHCSCQDNYDDEITENRPTNPSLPFSVESLKVLRLWQNCDYTTARRVRINSELSSELERILHEYIKYILQRELKSLTWLHELKMELQSDKPST